MAHPIPFDERQQIIQEMEDWRRTLPPPPIPKDLVGLGMKARAPDPRDDDLACVPGVAAVLAAGYPETFDLAKYLTGTYNQGSVPSCVAHTCAAMQSGHEMIEQGKWILFNAPAVHAETGNVNEGRWPDQILKYCQERGMPTADGTQRYKIQAYAFAEKDATFVDVVKATIASGRFVTVAMLLPSQFGWESNETATQGYHEVLGCGYDQSRLLIKNSWGNWGRDGFGWVSFRHLTQDNFQRGYVLAHAITDQRTSPQPDPEPQPQPQPEPQPQPDPTPQPVLKVTGYRNEGGFPLEVVPVAKAGHRVEVRGSFPQSGVLQASWGVHGLQVHERKAEALTVQAPVSTGVNAVLVRLEGIVENGPLLAVVEGPAPDPQPDPHPEPEPEPEPDSLPFMLNLSRSDRGGGWLRIYALATDAEGARASVSVNGEDLHQPRVIGKNGWATWLKQVAKPATVTVAIVADDGRRGVQTKTET